MARDTSYRDYIVYDVLGHLPDISARGMFGGWGIYQHGVIVGLIIDNVFYIKIDEATKNFFIQNGGEQFTYHNAKHGKTVSLPYVSVSEELLESRDEMERAVAGAYQCSVKGKKEYT